MTNMILRIMAKIKKFMYGRYGIDELYNFLFSVYLILAFINLFLGNSFISWLIFFIAVIAIYRVLSKNSSNRRKENAIYLEIVRKISKLFINVKRNFTDKEHIYKRCSCGTTIKVSLPKSYGIKHAKCPNCKKRNTFLALKKEKIIIIPKEKEAE